MLRKPQTTGFWVGRLPHWEVEGGRYFVTLHVHGAIPAAGRLRIRRVSQALRERAPHERDDPSRWTLYRTIFRELELWLDRTDQRNWLCQPLIQEMLTEAIWHRHRIGRWHILEYVLMPSHLHLFLEVWQGSLKESLEDFKRWTGHQAARLLQLPDGRFWQDEWFDHWSRSDEHDLRIQRYIRLNPEKAGLVRNYFDWRPSSWHYRENGSP